MSLNREDGIKELKTLPRVGDKLASILWRIGINSISDLKFQSAEELYERHNTLIGKKGNRALMYIVRCGIYVSCVREQLREKEKLQWFYWNDLKNPKCVKELEKIQNELEK